MGKEGGNQFHECFVLERGRGAGSGRWVLANLVRSYSTKLIASRLGIVVATFRCTIFGMGRPERGLRVSVARGAENCPGIWPCAILAGPPEDLVGGCGNAPWPLP